MQGGEAEFWKRSAARERRPFGWQFLALAALLHAVLLSLPAMRKSPAPPPQRNLQLWLQSERVDPPPTEVREQTPAPTPTVAESGKREAESGKRKAGSGKRETAAPAAELPSARQILESVEQREWQDAKPATAVIGRALDHETYARIARPLLPAIENLFADLTLPSSTQIVDRWLEPGGLQRVVLRLPNGMTLCGRQEPVNDFRPWEQMPMMFHPCGGGGMR